MICVCPACGTEARPDAEFCFRCGSRLRPEPQQARTHDSRPLNGDTILDSIYVDGYSGGKRVGISEDIQYCHNDRTLLRTGSGTNGVSRREVLLASIPYEICTVGGLIDYAKAHGVRFWYR